jgi:CubicO group peptidase (beta-lactamase class C family)
MSGRSRINRHKLCSPILLRVALCLVGSLLATTTAPGPASAQEKTRSQLVAKLDSAAAAHVARSAVAGASVAVVQGSDTLLHEGYGRADLEFEVPTPRGAVYEIGSLTKQFTAAAVLQLAAKDSLTLGASINEYLPEFDTGGHTITVRHLLHHTSGLSDWARSPELRALRRQELPRDTVLTLLEQKTLRFAPGTAMIYSNPGYFLLGRIIEEASGQSYAKYVEEHLLRPAGMEDSYYCDERAVVEKKAHGYTWREDDGFRHKEYLNHKWPYAAGSLCSTAGDLVTWTHALHDGKVLSDSMYQKMVTPGRLADGTTLRYGMGLKVYEASGRRVIKHAGGISGFLSEARYYPEEDLTVIVLQNTLGPKGPSALASRLVHLTIGPGEKPDAQPYEGTLSRFTGRYSGPARGELMTLRVNVEDDKLVVSGVGGSSEPIPLTHATGQTWQRGQVRYQFVQAGGTIVELRLDAPGGYYVLRKVGVTKSQ